MTKKIRFHPPDPPNPFSHCIALSEIKGQRYFKKDAQVLFLMEKTQTPCK
jgi:hypothetical protein